MERRFAGNGTLTSGRTLTGIAVPFNTETTVAGRRERVAPGAFSTSLASGRDVLALVNHDAGKLLARTKSGTLRLSERPDGLHYEIDLPDTSQAEDIRGLATAGSLGGVSIGFSVAAGGEHITPDGLRELRRVDLVEISVVTAFPAYPGTTTDLRSQAPRQARIARYLETI